MCPSPETRVPLEVFHRHVLVTHLKDNAAGVLDQLEQRANRFGEALPSLLADLVKSCYPKKPEWLEDNWYEKEVALDKCYFAHTDFRHRRVPKDQRFVDFLDSRLQEIEEGSFPCACEIRERWSEDKPMPPPLVREREPDKYYVLDGQLRVIRHWYHHKPNVKAFMYKGQLKV